MKKTLFISLIALAIFTGIPSGYAQPRDWRGEIQTRIHDARQRINRGIEHGSLTRHEARKLNEELSQIIDKLERKKANGLNPRERESIHRDLDRLNRDIRQEKHDDDRRRR